MSSTFDRMRDEHIKALLGRHTIQRRSERDLADIDDASRRRRLLQGPPEKPLPDVPLHKRGFGVMDEDAPDTRLP
jgi:hypothetical protein